MSGLPSPPSFLTGYGGFDIGGLTLALPMHQLREVQPCGLLQALADACPALAGGLALRGVLLPVLDLRVLLGLAPRAGSAANVLVVVHQGQLVGLLADAVTGVFEAQGQGRQQEHPPGAPKALAIGSVCRADDGRLCQVLDAAVLFATPGLPRIDDPEPARTGLHANQDRAHDAAPAERALMLLRCGSLALAVDALLVHTTLPAATPRPSACAGGACVGVLDWNGGQVPAIDLAAWCGWPTRPAAGAGMAAWQAFLVALPAGHVAFLVDEVLDVVPVAHDTVVPLPALGLPRPSALNGVLPTAALAPALAARLARVAQRFLVVDSTTLQQDPDVLAWAGMNIGVVHADAGTPTAQAATGATRFITYELDGETATPIAQVCEILPYRPVAAPAGAGAAGEADALLDIVVERGRAIPVFCLSRLTGLPAPRVTPAASVLVVEQGGELVGFAVPHLRAIASAHWQPQLPATMAGGTPQALALLGEGEQAHLCPVLDLQALAGRMQARETA